jgi:undecaprenyl-diphosphatase
VSVSGTVLHVVTVSPSVRWRLQENAMGFSRRVVRFDDTVERLVASRRSGPADALAHLLASAADRSKVWVGLAGLRALLDRRAGHRAALRTIAVVAVESGVIHAVVKPGFRRVRPLTDVDLRFGARRPPSSSFPSGHAASAATAAVLLADGMNGWGPPLAVLALAIGWSRVQTGLHHASDVIGGLVIGAVVGRCAKGLLPIHSVGAHD